MGRDNIEVGSPDQHRGRMRLGSKVSFSSGGGLGPGINVGSSRRSVNGVIASLRPANRPRTGSSVSFQATPSLASVSPQTSPAARFSAMLPDNSQRGLERVIKSRLVETFLSITVPSPASTSGTDNTEPCFPSHLSSRPTRSHSSSPSREEFTTHCRRGSSIRGSNLSVSVSPNTKSFSSSRPGLLSSRPDGKSHVSSTSIPSQKSSTLGSSLISSRPPHALMTNKPAGSSVIPNHLSIIHRPSTNPSFPINTQSKSDFAEWTDVSGQKLHIEIWGKVGSYWPGAGDTNENKENGKERQVNQEINKRDWRVLEQWDLDLEELVPLPVEVGAFKTNQFPDTTKILVIP